MLPKPNAEGAATDGATARHRLAVPSGDYGHGNAAGGGGPGSSSGALSSTVTPHQYLARILDPGQMDLQSALDQMRTLLTLQPQRIYKTSYYRKQTKNHWARDDPAFAALQIVLLAFASIAYGVAFRPPRSLLTSILSFAFKSIVINYLAVGILAATAGKAVADRHLASSRQSTTHVRQSVEWLYAFDIHCNAFFPWFVLVYGVQFFLLPVVLGNTLVSLIISNTIFAVAFAWYFYITHLGYRALPFLTNTEVFMFPIAAVAFLYVFNIVGYPFGLGFNASRIMAYIYFD